MKITSRTLGQVDIADEQVIEMPSGMIGFPALRRYALFPFPGPDVPFLWWQCIDEPSLCFILIDPTLVCPDYEVSLPAEELADIYVKSSLKSSVYAVVTVPSDPREMTVNLMGPIVINHSVRKAKQLVLTDPRYTTRHRVLREAPGHACANSQAE
ncbi:flagellar assembly protein FliW [Candidatus Poribacteria bacterium]|nr:flagellar assembly protein FliW [Candidatus Poribacteria bacterium]